MTTLGATSFRDMRGWLVAPAVICLLVLFVYPFIYGLVISLEPIDQPSLWYNYVNFFTEPTQWATILVTLKPAVPATLINVGVAVPVAFALRQSPPAQKVRPEKRRV